jgi:hypothetical protein
VGADGLTDEQAVWDAPTKSSRFNITNFLPKSLSIPDTNVLSVGPFSEDRSIAVYLSHKAPGKTDYEESTPNHQFVRISQFFALITKMSTFSFRKILRLAEKAPSHSRW